MRDAESTPSVEVRDAGSCVFLDKGAEFLEKTNEFVAKYDEVL